MSNTTNVFTKFFELAQLAQASYVDLQSTERDQVALELAVKSDLTADGNSFSAKQAQVFADSNSGFTVINHTPNDAAGFSATVFRDKQTGEITLAIRGTEPSANDASGSVDLTDTDLDIALYGVAPRQIVSLYNYWQRLI